MQKIQSTFNELQLYLADLEAERVEEGVSGGGGGGTALQLDLDQARADLDESQEEVTVASQYLFDT